MTPENGTIMIIEDNEQDYEMLVRALREVGIENPVTHYDNGDDALDLLKENTDAKPEFIFLDLNLPGIDGRDVLKEIKDNEKTEDIPVIVITSSSKTSDIEQCYENGTDNYITKPMGMQGYITAAKTIHSFITNPMRL